MKTTGIKTTCGIAALCLIIVPTLSAELTLTWSSVGSGGGTRSSAGEFVMTATISDPAAGEPASGGEFTMTGGFQPGLAPACPNTCGDINGSGGNVDLVDFASFAVCFNALPSSSAACACSDLNQDGAINLVDFATLSLIFNGVSTNTVPNCP